ncbi:MAG: hypothetical protein ACK56Q_08995, partial [Pirellulaceae bacterium]
CNAAPPGLVLGVHGELVMTPTAWHGRIAWVESAFVAMTIVARTFLIQRFPSLFRPGGPTLPLPVATATGGVATFYFSSSCSLRAIGSGVFAIAAMGSCRCLMTRRLAKSHRPVCHAIGSHTLQAWIQVLIADTGMNGDGLRHL